MFKLRAMGMYENQIAQAVNVSVKIVKGWFECEGKDRTVVLFECRK